MYTYSRLRTKTCDLKWWATITSLPVKDAYKGYDSNIDWHKYTFIPHKEIIMKLHMFNHYRPSILTAKTSPMPAD